MADISQIKLPSQSAQDDPYDINAKKLNGQLASYYATASDLTSEAAARSSADTALQAEIDAINAQTDVVDVLGTYEELLVYDVATHHIVENDIVKILEDSSHDNAISYWRYKTAQPSEGTYIPAHSTGYWLYIGSQGPFYTKAQTDATFVPQTRTVNGQALSDNVSITLQSLGVGYGTCTTAEATTAKVATLSGYVIASGGLVCIKFTNAVPASATLNINSQGAKAIHYQGSAITAGVIKAGKLVTFVYDGTNYQVISIDESGGGAVEGDYLLADEAGSATDPNPINADTLEGYGADHFLTSASLSNYYTKGNIDSNFYNTTQSDNRYYTKTEIGNSYYTKVDINNNYYNKTSIDTNHYTKTATNTLLDAKAPLESPAFTGTPTVAAGTDYTTAKLRNVILSTADPTSGDGNNGDVWIKYTN